MEIQLVPGTLNINFYVIKIDENGKEDWVLNYDIDGGILGDISYQATELDSTFAILAYTWNITEDVLPNTHILKLNKNSGELLSFFPVGDLENSLIRKFISSKDNDFILFDYFNSELNEFGNDDMGILKIDNLGNEIFRKTYQESQIKSNSSYEYFDIWQDNEENIYVAGGGHIADSSFLLNPITKLSVAKLDNKGNLLWLNEVIGARQATSMTQQSDGLLVSSNKYEKRAHLFKFSFDGILRSFV